jgi:hypothetical protein
MLEIAVALRPLALVDQPLRFRGRDLSAPIAGRRKLDRSRGGRAGLSLFFFAALKTRFKARRKPPHEKREFNVGYFNQVGRDGAEQFYQQVVYLLASVLCYDNIINVRRHG